MERTTLYQQESQQIEVTHRVLRAEDFQRTQEAIEHLQRAEKFMLQKEQEVEQARTQAREVGFDQGFNEGLQKAMQALAVEQHSLLTQLEANDRRRHEDALQIAIQLLHKITPDLSESATVQALLRAALHQVDPKKVIAMRVHPNIEVRLKKWAASNNYFWEVIADPGLEPLDCVLETKVDTLTLGYTAQVNTLSQLTLGEPS